MATNRLVLIALLEVTIINPTCQCEKMVGCAETVYNFETGVRAFPDEDSINIGDTIWLQIDDSVIFTDVNSNKQVDYSNAANLGTALSFEQLISLNNVNTKATNMFSYSLLIGSEVIRSDTNKYREYIFSEINNRYQFKLAIIPKTEGVFKLFVSNAANVYRENDACTKANFEINFEETDQHLYLNQVSFPDVNLEPGGGVYLFVVN